MKKALITGITGQDGSYLAEFLLAKGYEVHGIVRRSSTITKSRIDHLYQDSHVPGARFFLHYGDLSDGSNLNRLLSKIEPEEIYHLGAQSHVRISFDVPEYTGDVTGLGTLRLLDAIRDLKLPAKIYNAASSEMYGNATVMPITENTEFAPRSPYACAKLYSYWMTVNYREAYNMFAVNGILFNHESPRRGETFVTRKISRALASIKSGASEKFYLGNMNAKRDWGFAPEYVEGMWMMLQADKPDDYVLATGEAHSVREYVEEAAAVLDMHIEWKGEGKDERGICTETGKEIVAIDPYYFRPTEIDVLIGSPEKATRLLGWKPKTSFQELVRIMTEAEYGALTTA